MASNQASTSASMLTPTSKVDNVAQKHQQHHSVSTPSLAHLHINHSASPRALFARSRTSSIGIDIAAATSGSTTRSRAGSVGPKDSPQTPSPPPFDIDSLDRGPGTPDFTLDRFASIRGARNHRHGPTRQHSSLATSSHCDRSKAAETKSTWTSRASQSALNALSEFRTAIVEARMPPLRPHLPALLFLISVFVGSTICILLALSTLPLRLPSHITDLTLTEIRDMSMSLRTYSHSSNRAFAHTLAVLGTFFTWKQSFTVPGSLIMNVVFGAMYGPFWGTIFTSLLTAVGGMFCYLLVQPVGPLISAVPGFGKGLQKMRRALQGSAGYTAPSARNATYAMASGLRSPLAMPVAKQRSLRFSNSSPIRRTSKSIKNGGKGAAQNSLWSYLLVLRLLPIVPYGLMNIACAVLQVPLLPYTVTLALGSIPWNACTVQIGDLLLEVVSALPGSSAATDVASEIGSGGFRNAPAPGSSAMQAASQDGKVQSGLQAITEKIWNRDMLLKLTLMTLVSLAPMALQYYIKRRQTFDDAYDAYEEEHELLYNDDESLDMPIVDDDDDAASLAEKGSNKSQSGDDQDTDPEDSSVDHKHPTILSGLFDIRAWRTPSQSGTSDLPISLHDFNVQHFSRLKQHTKRYSSPLNSALQAGHVRQPSIKRAVAHAVI